MLKGKMEFRLGSEQRVCGPGDVVVMGGPYISDRRAFECTS
jgi:hypothetical protein